MHPIDSFILKDLSYNGQFLFHKGKPITQRKGRRFVYFYNCAYYDAASIVFLMAFKVWPPKLLKFLDDDYCNLSIENLKLADCRKDKAKMQQQHLEYMDCLNGIPKIVEAVPEGFELVRHKGTWVLIPKAKGVWDDRNLRLKAVLKEQAHAKAMLERGLAVSDRRIAALK